MKQYVMKGHTLLCILPIVVWTVCLIACSTSDQSLISKTTPTQTKIVQSQKETVTPNTTIDPEYRAFIDAEKERIISTTTNLRERYAHVTFQPATPVLSVEEVGAVDVVSFASEKPYTHFSIYFFDSAEAKNKALDLLELRPISANTKSLAGGYGELTAGYTTYDQDPLTDDLVGYIDGRIISIE